MLHLELKNDTTICGRHAHTTGVKGVLVLVLHVHDEPIELQPFGNNELDAWKGLTNAIISSRVGGELTDDKDFTTLANSVCEANRREIQ
jgi:hypothetical protein